jgi:hypothetical protein
MKKINLIKIVAVLGMLTFASCQKEKIGIEEESLLQSYPDEITLDNWEQFVHAPQYVIDYHSKKEVSKHIKKSFTQRSSQSCCTGRVVSGNVKAFNGSWSPIYNVIVDEGSCQVWTDILGNYCIPDGYSGSLCMNYYTSSSNGVSVMDALLIRRHILLITPLTEVRQYIAADVNGDSYISEADVTEIKGIILNPITSFSSNILFIPEQEYIDAQNNLNTGTFVEPPSYSSCIPPTLINERVIKMGDVNGSFVF